MVEHRDMIGEEKYQPGVLFISGFGVERRGSRARPGIPLALGQAGLAWYNGTPDRTQV